MFQIPQHHGSPRAGGEASERGAGRPLITFKNPPYSRRTLQFPRKTVFKWSDHIAWKHRQPFIRDYNDWVYYGFSSYSGKKHRSIRVKSNPEILCTCPRVPFIMAVLERGARRPSGRGAGDPLSPSNTRRIVGEHCISWVLWFPAPCTALWILIKICGSLRYCLFWWVMFEMQFSHINMILVIS